MTIRDLRRYIIIDENNIINFQVQTNSLFVEIRLYFGCVREVTKFSSNYDKKWPFLAMPPIRILAQTGNKP